MSQQNNISEARILCYGSLYLPVSMALLPVNLYVLPFYAELGIPLYAMSIVIFAARLSDAITDPLIGIWSDRTRTRWGRRKPWVVGGIPLLLLSIYMLFIPPENPSIWYFGTWIVLLYLAYTLVALPYYAWGRRCRRTTTRGCTSAAAVNSSTSPAICRSTCCRWWLRL